MLHSDNELDNNDMTLTPEYFDNLSPEEQVDFKARLGEFKGTPDELNKFRQFHRYYTEQRRRDI